MDESGNADWYSEIGELVNACGQDWFFKTLQASLQSVFHFDYFMLARYRRKESLEVLAADVMDPHWHRALQWLETENRVIEPIYQLFSADKSPQGIHDMTELVEGVAKLDKPSVDISKLPHVIEDPDEEIGWRTMGWPIHQQETCVLTHLGKDQLIAISLFNNGLELDSQQSEHQLRKVYPALGAILSAHFSTPAGISVRGLTTLSSDTATNAPSPNLVDDTKVETFFKRHYDIQLTAKERAVFSYLLAGATTPAVADVLKVSPHTVRTHRRNVYKRLGNGRLTELINQFHNDGRHR